VGRKLAEDEKRKIEAYARAHADLSQGHVISVTVADEIDDDGKVHFVMNYAKETVMPKDWKP
jgi:hypothetical protein